MICVKSRRFFWVIVSLVCKLLIAFKTLQRKLRKNDESSKHRKHERRLIWWKNIFCLFYSKLIFSPFKDFRWPLHAARIKFFCFSKMKHFCRFLPDDRKCFHASWHIKEKQTHLDVLLRRHVNICLRKLETSLGNESFHNFTNVLVTWTFCVGSVRLWRNFLTIAKTAHSFKRIFRLRLNRCVTSFHRGRTLIGVGEILLRMIDIWPYGTWKTSETRLRWLPKWSI